MSKIRFKVSRGDDVRRISLSTKELSYNNLFREVSIIFDLTDRPFRIKYFDDEQELITVSSDKELNDAMKLLVEINPNATSRFYVWLPGEVNDIQQSMMVSSIYSSSMLQPSMDYSGFLPGSPYPTPLPQGVPNNLPQFNFQAPSPQQPAPLRQQPAPSPQQPAPYALPPQPEQKSEPSEEEDRKREMMERARQQVARAQELRRRQEEALAAQAQQPQHPPQGRQLSEGDPRPNSVLPAGKEFTKSWVIMNSGQSAWPEGVRVVVEGEDGLEAHVPSLPPNAQHEIHLTFSADVVLPTKSRPQVWKCSVETEDGTKIISLTPVLVNIAPAAPPADSKPDINPESNPAFIDALGRLVTLGFEESACRDALLRTGSDFEAALDLLTMWISTPFGITINDSPNEQSGTSQVVENTLTLKGSCDIVRQFFGDSVCSILDQRGIYPRSSFKRVQKYGIPIFVADDPELHGFLQKYMKQVGLWLQTKNLSRLNLVISSQEDNTPLEIWTFDVYVDHNENEQPSNSQAADRSAIKKNIQAIIRQICASVTYLPLIETQVKFDLLAYTDQGVEVPAEWEETEEVEIENAEQVELRQLDTSIHRVGTKVQYRVDAF